MALYIEPEWLKEFRPGWAASGAPGFFERPSGEVSPRILAVVAQQIAKTRPLKLRCQRPQCSLRIKKRGQHALHGFDTLLFAYHSQSYARALESA